MPKIAWTLGYGGLIPFITLAMTVVLGFEPDFLPTTSLAGWLAAYAAVIFSFLGAVHWGAALGAQMQSTPNTTNRLFIYSVIPAVAAWFALLLPIKIALYILALLVICAYLADRMLLFPLLQSDYARLRLHLTAVVSTLLLIAAFFS